MVLDKCPHFVCYSLISSLELFSILQMFVVVGYLLVILLYFDLRPGPKMLFQGDTPEGSDTFQWPVIERDRMGGLRLMIWDKVKVPLCH